MKNTLHLVSIITPTYNHSKYIKQCIDSVINQTYKNWEMIIVNDGSTDNTIEVVQEYARDEARIKVIDQLNIGIYRLADTYNRALSESKGKYVAILEGDDFWGKDKLKIQIRGMEEDNSVIVSYAKVNIVGSDSAKVFHTAPVKNKKLEQYYNNKPAGRIFNVLLFEGFIPALTIIIRKKELLNIGGFHQGMVSVDGATLKELALLGSFKYEEVVLGSYRVYTTQVTKMYPVLIREKFYSNTLKFLNEKKNHPALKEFFRITEVNKYHKKKISIAYSRSGRYYLVRKEYKKARHDYFKSLRTSINCCPLWKLRSVIGIIFSYFRLDVEWLAKFIGKKYYREN